MTNKRLIKYLEKNNYGQPKSFTTSSGLNVGIHPKPTSSGLNVGIHPKPGTGFSSGRVIPKKPPTADELKKSKMLAVNNKIQDEQASARGNGSFDELAKAMLDEKNLANGVGSNFSRSERKARIGSRRIQNQRLLAKMFSGQQQVGMRQSGAMARTMRQGLDDAANIELQGQNQLANTRLTGQNQLANTGLRGQNQLDRLVVQDQYNKESANRDLQGRLLMKGVPGGGQLDNLGNSPGFADRDTSGIQVPVSSSNPYTSKTIGQYDNVGNKVGERLIGFNQQTGQVMDMQGQAGVDGYPGQISIEDRFSAGNLDLNNLSPQDEVEVVNIAKTNPGLYQQMLEQAQAAAQQ